MIFYIKICWKYLLLFFFFYSQFYGMWILIWISKQGLHFIIATVYIMLVKKFIIFACTYYAGNTHLSPLHVNLIRPNLTWAVVGGSIISWELTNYRLVIRKWYALYLLKKFSKKLLLLLKCMLAICVPVTVYFRIFFFLHNVTGRNRLYRVQVFIL